MRQKVKNLWYRLQANFLFVPATMALGAILLAATTAAIDNSAVGQKLSVRWLFYSGEADGARAVLSTIAGSMITIAGVVFSITIVVLTLASSQFGPRLVKNFMNVRANQMVLGTFVATFIYGILVLGTVNGTTEKPFVPGLSVTTAIVMSLGSLAVLIFFIHSVSESIQAQNIIARVRRDLEKAVDRIFPEKLGTATDPAHGPIERDYDIPTTCDREVCQVRAARSGYLQSVETEALMEIAVEGDLLIHLGHRPGNFVTRGSVLVTVWPGEKVDEALAEKINAIFILGAERTLEQDVEFAISQLAEIAVRALSPGINDPITAITCIDWLGATLCQLNTRKMPATHHYDGQSRLRLICKTFTFAGMLDAAFDMIRQNAYAVPAVSIRLLETIATVLAQTHLQEDRDALLRQAAMVAHGCRLNLPSEHDRADLDRRYQAAISIPAESETHEA